jgi:hypothetical protein
MVLTMSPALIFTKYSKSDIMYESSSVDTLRTRAIVRSHFESRLDGRQTGESVVQRERLLKECQCKGGPFRLEIGGYIYERPPLCLRSQDTR